MRLKTWLKDWKLFENRLKTHLGPFQSSQVVTLIFFKRYKNATYPFFFQWILGCGLFRIVRLVLNFFPFLANNWGTIRNIKLLKIANCQVRVLPKKKNLSVESTANILYRRLSSWVFGLVQLLAFFLLVFDRSRVSLVFVILAVAFHSTGVA